MNIEKILNLLNEAEQLTEGIADNLLRDAKTSIYTIFPTDNQEINKIVSDAEEKWKKIKGDAIKYPNVWKYFLANVVKHVMYRDIMLATDMNTPENKKLITKIDRSFMKMLKGKNYNLSGIVSEIKHYSYIFNTKFMDKYNPNNSTDVFNDLEKFEEDYKESVAEEDQLISHEDAEDTEVILDFKDGFAWYDLNTNICELEGDAMGHCGNGGSYDTNDNILSLRKKIKVGREYHYKPFLTFIENHGVLGEMKGRGNEKPAERYHKYIVELLKLDRIKGIRGGGYLPQNNFALSDLSEDLYDEIVEHKGKEFTEPYVDLHEVPYIYVDGGKFSIVYEEATKNYYVGRVIEGFIHDYDVSIEKSDIEYAIRALEEDNKLLMEVLSPIKEYIPDDVIENGDLSTFLLDEDNFEDYDDYDEYINHIQINILECYRSMLYDVVYKFVKDELEYYFDLPFKNSGDDYMVGVLESKNNLRSVTRDEAMHVAKHLIEEGYIAQEEGDYEYYIETSLVEHIDNNVPYYGFSHYDHEGDEDEYMRDTFREGWDFE